MHTDIELELKSSLKDMDRKLQDDMKEAFDHVNAAATHVPPRPVDQHELTYPFNVSFSSFMEGKGGPRRSEKSCEQLQQDYKDLAQKIWFGSEKIDVMMNTFFADWNVGAQAYKNLKILHRTQKLAVRTSDLLNTVMAAKECAWAKDTKNAKKSRAFQQLEYVMNKANPGLQEAHTQLTVNMFLANKSAEEQAKALEAFIAASLGPFGSASVSSLHVNTAHLAEDLGKEKVEEVLQKKIETAKFDQHLGSNLENEENEEEDLPASKPKTFYWKAVAWDMECLKDVRVKLEMEGGSSNSAFEWCLKAQSNNDECSKKQFYVNDKECWCIKQGKTCSIRENNIRADQGLLSVRNTLYERTEPPAWETQSMLEVSSNTPPLELMIPEGVATNSTSGLEMQSALAEIQRSLDGGCDGPLAFLCLIGGVLMLVVLALWIIALIITCGVILLAIVVWLIGLLKCILQFLFKWLTYLATYMAGVGTKPTFNWGTCLEPWWLVKGQDAPGNLMLGCLCVLALPGMANSGLMMYGLHPCR